MYRNRDRKELTIHQSNYIHEILFRFKMVDCKPVKTPIDVGGKLKIFRNEGGMNANEYTGKEVLILDYRAAIGALMFLAVVSRPDIAYAVNYLSRFLSGYNHQHCLAVKRIFRYLKLLIDNQSAIRLIKNPEFHQRTKHIDIRHHFVRECYKRKMIKIF